MIEYLVGVKGFDILNGFGWEVFMFFLYHSINSDDEVILNKKHRYFKNFTKIISHRVVRLKLGFNDDVHPLTDFYIFLEPDSLLPSQWVVGRAEDKFVVVQTDLGNVGKVATQECKDAPQSIRPIKDHQVEGDLESWTPCCKHVNLRILFHLRNYKKIKCG